MFVIKVANSKKVAINFVKYFFRFIHFQWNYNSILLFYYNNVLVGGSTHNKMILKEVLQQYTTNLQIAKYFKNQVHQISCP